MGTTLISKIRRAAMLSVILCLVLACFMMISARPAYAADKPLKGKKVLIEGDSIQYGFGKFIETSVDSMGAKKIKNISQNNATLGVSPIGNIKNCTYFRIKKLRAKEIKKYDYIIIAAGTNDYFSGYKVRPGKVYSTARNTTAGALNKVIRKIRKRSPKTKIVVVTPIHRWPKSGNCDKRKNRYGKTLKDYRSAITKVAGQYENVYVIQGDSLSKASEMKMHKYSDDGVHPNNRYAKILAKRFRKAFKKDVLRPVTKAAVDK